MFDTLRADYLSIEDRLMNDMLIWVSSVRPDHRPDIYLHWFLWHEKKLFLFFHTKTHDLPNLQHTPFVACSLEPINLGEEVIMLEGKVELFQTTDLKDLFAVYLEKYQILINAMGWKSETLLQKRLHTVCITPTDFIPWPPDIE